MNMSQSNGASIIHIIHTFVGTIESLAFLPFDQVTDGIQHLCDNIQQHAGLNDLWNYFDTTYVTGTYRWLRGPAAANDIPQFPPYLWDTHLQTVNDSPICVDSTKNCNTVSTLILQNRDGNPQLKRFKRTPQEIQARLCNLCQAFADGANDVGDFLSSVAHHIKFTNYKFYICLKFSC